MYNTPCHVSDIAGVFPAARVCSYRDRVRCRSPDVSTGSRQRTVSFDNLRLPQHSYNHTHTHTHTGWATVPSTMESQYGLSIASRIILGHLVSELSTSINHSAHSKHF